MKNKKIVVLTVAMVAVVLIGVLGMARFFENSWRQENTIDNSLSVDESNLYQEPINIDYPFYMLNDNTIFQDKEFQQEYPSIVEMYNRTEEKPDYLFNNFNVPDGNYTYQDVANKCGEIIKYLYGRADLQNNKAAVMYDYFNDADKNQLIAKYWYKDEFDVFFNPVSGEIEQLECRPEGSAIREDTSHTTEWQVDYFTDDVKLDVEQMIYETISVIKPEAEIVDIKYEAENNYMFGGVYHLRLRIEYSDGNEAKLAFCTRDFDVYELNYYLQKGFVY